MSRESEERRSAPDTAQSLVGAGTLALGALMAWGAAGMPADAGYAGVGPNFLPWVVSLALVVCGALLLWQARRGGFRAMPAPDGQARGHWVALAWVAAGVLLNAALITRIGFVLSCALCYMLAVRGLRLGEGKPTGGARQALVDLAIGMLISAPTFWLFTKVLTLTLPGLVRGGWI
jgi:putative tricarboxylic transport membrane protein